MSWRVGPWGAGGFPASGVWETQQADALLRNPGTSVQLWGGMPVAVTCGTARVWPWAQCQPATGCATWPVLKQWLSHQRARHRLRAPQALTWTWASEHLPLDQVQSTLARVRGAPR